MAPMYILGLETTCDETSAAIVKEGHEICSHVIFSQAQLHEQYGGVVPELACRRHIDLIEPAIEKALDQANMSLDEIDGFAAAYAPGLIGAILIGLNSAKTLSLMYEKPFYAIDHIEAHLFASTMGRNVEMPALGVVISGGHTCLLLVEGIGKYQLISTTKDDAIGESFDKVAKMLDLPYPGGPSIEKLAREGKAVFPLKAGHVKNNPLSFSFSGIKTAVRYLLQKEEVSSTQYPDVAASFQEAVFSDLLSKIQKAQQIHPVKSVIFGGGVACNQTLQKKVSSQIQVPAYFPSKELATDNAAMIAGLAFHKPVSSLEVEAKPRVSFWN